MERKQRTAAITTAPWAWRPEYARVGPLSQNAAMVPPLGQPPGQPLGQLERLLGVTTLHYR